MDDKSENKMIKISKISMNENYKMCVSVDGRAIKFLALKFIAAIEIMMKGCWKPAVSSEVKIRNSVGYKI